MAADLLIGARIIIVQWYDHLSIFNHGGHLPADQERRCQCMAAIRSSELLHTVFSYYMLTL